MRRFLPGAISCSSWSCERALKNALNLHARRAASIMRSSEDLCGCIYNPLFFCWSMFQVLLLASRSHLRLATVDRKLNPGYIAAVRCGKEQISFGDLFAVTDAAHRDLLTNIFINTLHLLSLSPSLRIICVSILAGDM